MKPMMPENIRREMASRGVVAVLVIDEPDNAELLAEALIRGGVRCMELTLRTGAAMESLHRIRESVPRMMAGVGTVLHPWQVDVARSALGEFGVAPGLHPAVVRRCRKKHFPFAPGVATASEIEQAMEYGCTVLKFFHAEAMGGAKTLSGINAPYRHLNLGYMPLGGVNLENMHEYLELPEVLAIGGSWIAPRALIQQREWDLISRNAENAMRVFHDVRG